MGSCLCLHNYIRKIVEHNGVIYAATVGGLSISTDMGETFLNKVTANGLGSNNLNSVFVRDGSVWVASWAGLALSTDGGNTFTNFTAAGNLLASDVVNDVVVDDQNVYVATTGGVSIEALTSDPPMFTTRTMAHGLGSNTVYSIDVSGTTVVAGTSSGASFSTDSGASFTNKTTANGLPGNLVYDVLIEDRIYLGTRSGFAYTDDNGGSFTSKTYADGVGPSGVTHVFYDSGKVYLSTATGLIISR